METAPQRVVPRSSAQTTTEGADIVAEEMTWRAEEVGVEIAWTQAENKVRLNGIEMTREVSMKLIAALNWQDKWMNFNQGAL